MSGCDHHHRAHSEQLLFEAVKQNDTNQLIDLVVSTHCDPRYIRNERQETLLHVACQLNHQDVLDMVRILVEVYQCDPLLCDQHSLTVYHYACLSRNLVVLSYLFQSKNYNYVSDSQLRHSAKLMSPLRNEFMLIAASKSGSVAMTRFIFMLLTHHGSHYDTLNIKLNLFKDPLNALCRRVQCFKQERGWQHPLYPYSIEGTSLYEACCAGNLDTMKFFIEELKMATYSHFDLSLQSRNNKEKSVYSSLLETACRLNNLEIAKYLSRTKGFSPVQNTSMSGYVTYFKVNADPCFSLEGSRNPNLDTCSSLHVAIRSGNIEFVKEIVSENLHHILASDHDTLLHSACISGKKEMVAMLLDKLECNINAHNSNRDTPLHVACEWGSLDICLCLLEQNRCNINETNSKGHTPLTLAVKHGRFGIFQTLLTKGADITVTVTSTLETPLHLACCHDTPDFTSALLANENFTIAHLNASDKYGDTPLFNACRVGDVNLVHCLVKMPDCETLYANEVTKDTPAHIACRMNRLDILGALLAKGIDTPLKCNQLNHVQKSLLHLACETDAEAILIYLITNKVCEQNNHDCDGRTPLHIATMRGNFNIFKTLLMSEVCKINDEDKDGNTVLHYLCSRDVVDPKLVQLVLEYCNGISLIEKQNQMGYNPLHYVCENGSIQVLQCLLNESMTQGLINDAFFCFNKDGNTPLHLAFKERRIMMIKYIFKNTKLNLRISKAICLKNSEGDNVFHLAMKHSEHWPVHNTDGTIFCKCWTIAVLNIVLLLVNSVLQEQDVVLSFCHKSESQNTPIQQLIIESQTASSVISCLLQSKLSQNSKKQIFSVMSTQGDTLIHLATEKKRHDVVRLLLEERVCNPTTSNNRNESPLHIVGRNGESEMGLLLCKHGCDTHQLDKSGCSPLFNALKHNNISFLEQLIENGQWEPEKPVLKVACNEPLQQYYIECYRQIMICSEPVQKLSSPFTLPLPHLVLLNSSAPHNVQWVADLVVKYNLPNLNDSLDNTILHLCASRFFDVSCFKKVLALNDCEVNQKNVEGNTPLHIACALNNMLVVTLLLESDKCMSLSMKNMDNHTPLYYAKRRELLNYLIINGANPKDVADSARVQGVVDRLEKVKGDHSLDPTVPVLVLGNSLAGKTTLIKSLTGTYKWDQLNPSIGQIEQKTERTSGVNLLEYKVLEKDNVRILFYDYAGQHEFHGTHSHHLQSLMSNLQSAENFPFLFLVTLDVTACDKLKQLTYWTNFIKNCQMSSATNEPKIIVIGSHVDKLLDDETRENVKESLITTMNNISGCNELFLENPILLDCRTSKACELDQVKILLLECTKPLNEYAELDNRCHLIFSYLYEHYPDKPVRFNDLYTNLRMRKPIGFDSHESDSPFITASYLKKLLKSMHSRQHILLVGQTDQFDFWILTAKAQNEMFKNIHGLLFAREDFKEHLEIESTVGVLSSTFLKDHFSYVDYKMLQEFLVYSELCKMIEDEDTLNLIEHGRSEQEEKMDLGSNANRYPNCETSTHESTGVSIGNSIKYFFFPGLIKEKGKNLHAWEHAENYSYSSGWCLECAKDNFFYTRFLQVLLLRLTFQFAVADEPKKKLNRRCNIWRNGLIWSEQGVEMLVEVANQNQLVLVLVRCIEDAELGAIRLRSAVVKEVHKVKEMYCSATKTTEFVIYKPTLDNCGSLSKSTQKVSMNKLVSAIKSGVHNVQSTLCQYIVINRNLLCFEPYAEIGDELLTSLFDSDKANRNISNEILSNLYSQVHAVPSHVIQFKKLVSELGNPISHRNLRELFDKYSIFHGRNPKVSCRHLY